MSKTVNSSKLSKYAETNNNVLKSQNSEVETEMKSVLDTPTPDRSPKARKKT